MANAEATLLDELVDDVTMLVEWLETQGPVDAAGRELLHGLMRDLWVIGQASEKDDGKDDAAWLEPFVDATVAKLALLARLFPKAERRIEETSQKVAGHRARGELVASLRAQAGPLLVKLRPGARTALARSGVEAALQSKRLLRRQGAADPEVSLAARLLEGLGRHLALAQAEGSADTADDDVRALAARLEGWLEERGATCDRPAEGAAAPADAVKIASAGRVAGKTAGAVVQATSAGVSVNGTRLAAPVVVTSPGAESHLLAAVRSLLAATSEDTQDELGPTLAALGRTVRERFDDPAATPADRAGASLELVAAVRTVLDTPAALSPLLEALSKDLAGARAELIVPSPRTPKPEDESIEGSDVFSREVPVGEIVALIRPGLRVAGKLVRPALVRVSQGEPPPGIIDEVVELLPESDPRGAHLRARLDRARCLAAGDAGALLARELADLALQLKDDVLGEAARRALRLVVDEPPAQLAARPGWEAVKEFLDANLEQLLQEEQGQMAALRLVRPYLQGLRTGQTQGARLRSLGESMDPMLRLFDEQMASTAREWLFAELERLGGDGYPGGGGAQRLVRTAANALKGFYKNGEATAATELTSAMKKAGLRVYPEEADRLDKCPTPTALFHRIDAVYSDAPRFKVQGEFSPAVAVTTSGSGALDSGTGAVGGDAEGEARETGSITLSLGAKPKVLGIIESDELKRSRIGGASAHLVAEITRLDRERLLKELQGDAGAERAFAGAVAALVTKALNDAKWQRGDADRQALTPLFDHLRDDLNVEVLPGYLTYRRLRELSRKLGERVKVDVVREGARRIELKQVGALYRDELLAPLDMMWCTGPPPAYVNHLRGLPWFGAVLDGEQPPFEMTPAAMDAVRDFDSPDAQSLEGVVRSLSILASWLATDQPNELEAFTKRVKTAPELELDFFPLPGRVYPRERILDAVDRSKVPDALEVVRDAGRDEGTAVRVERIAVYKDGRALSDEPRARFSLKALPKACEALTEALGPILSSDHVTGPTKAELRGHLARIALVPIGPGQVDVELRAFKTLLAARLIDPAYPDSPDNALHKAGAYLAKRLEAEKKLQVERFEGKKTVEEALKDAPPDSAEVEDVFAPVGSPELAQVRRPLVILEGTVLQKAFLMRGVPTSDVDVLVLDQVLTDSNDRFRGWVEGLGAVCDNLIDAKNKPTVPRTIQRIDEVRKKMFEQHKKKMPVLPPDTALRDLVRFIIDQVHRAEDVLAVLDDRSYRGAFGDLVFRDIVYRSAGPYLSKKFGIDIDTSVVAGADTQALTGKFKKENTGPKPKRDTGKIWSVIVPCYLQNGVAIRPATVRTGEY